MKKACFVVSLAAVLAGFCFAQSPRRVTSHQVEVVAEVSLRNQTGNTGGTLYTPKETGVFRVSFMLQCTKGDPANGQALEPTLNWGDDNGAEQYPFFIGEPDGGPYPPLSFVFIIKATSGDPIVWGVVPRNTQDTSEYEVYLALERIGPKVQ